jgi:hypothetical protein
MHKLAKRELQVTCSGKKWTIAIGSHHNLLIFFSRYPLEGALDLGDLSQYDFEQLVIFFAAKNNKTFTSSNKKWSFVLDKHSNLTIKFTQYPFVGNIELGDISKEHCQLLIEMFVRAQKL